MSPSSKRTKPKYTPSAAKIKLRKTRHTISNNDGGVIRVRYFWEVSWNDGDVYITYSFMHFEDAANQVGAVFWKGFEKNVQ